MDGCLETSSACLPVASPPTPNKYPPPLLLSKVLLESLYVASCTATCEMARQEIAAVRNTSRPCLPPFLVA